MNKVYTAWRTEKAIKINKSAKALAWAVRPKTRRAQSTRSC